MFDQALDYLQEILKAPGLSEDSRHTTGNSGGGSGGTQNLAATWEPPERKKPKERPTGEDSRHTSGSLLKTQQTSSGDPWFLPFSVLMELKTGLVTMGKDATSEQRIFGLAALFDFMLTWRAVQGEITYDETDLKILADKLESLRGKV